MCLLYSASDRILLSEVNQISWSSLHYLCVIQSITIEKHLSTHLGAWCCFLFAYMFLFHVYISEVHRSLGFWKDYTFLFLGFHSYRYVYSVSFFFNNFVYKSSFNLLILYNFVCKAQLFPLGVKMGLTAPYTLLTILYFSLHIPQMDLV